MISLEVFLVGLGSVMLVLGYLTAKIKKIEEINFNIYKKLNPPKFKDLEIVQYMNCTKDKYIVIKTTFDAKQMCYHYKILNTRTYNTCTGIHENFIDKFPLNKTEEEEEETE